MLVLLLEAGLSAAGALQKENATETRGGAARLPLPTSRLGLGFEFTVTVRVRCGVGLFWADAQA